ncbi:MAG: iron-sulfur cluster assembly accessory protein [Nitrospirae bacterium]|nr:iron-sulfur cluster assembly accessory protein [Nitrospirota bacterium]
METSTTHPVTLTENAIREIKRIMEINSVTGGGLRVGVTGGGCAGFTYTLNFDNEIRSDDQVYEVEGIKVIVDVKSSLYLFGTTVDYTSDLTGGGFKFMNPQAKGSCGCGTSFSA